MMIEAYKPEYTQHRHNLRLFNLSLLPSPFRRGVGGEVRKAQSVPVLSIEQANVRWRHTRPWLNKNKYLR